MTSLSKAPAKVHGFHERLKFSHLAEDLPLWKEVYDAAFPGHYGFVSCRNNPVKQRLGIDRQVYLSPKQTIGVDEKVREKWYNDIALEYISVDTSGAPGWVEKRLWCDWIAYAVIPVSKCFLLPVPPLQRAWARHKKEWQTKYKHIEASNEGYTTHSCAVPVDTLYRAINEMLVIDFTPPGKLSSNRNGELAF